MTLQSLIVIFEKQAQFTAAYSPLYQRLFETVAKWLETEPNSNVVEWMVNTSMKRTPLETSLLLMAGVHREVLLHSPGTEEIRAYYPSVGGKKSCKDKDLPEIFRYIVESQMERLTPTLQKDTVQTNETGRGFFWLVPTILTRWPCVHVVDLGASAGLNLVADQRRFTLLSTDDSSASVIGLAQSPQFTVKCEPHLPDPIMLASELTIPMILSRNGCDLNPFPLNTERDRASLESFVWADQVERFHRLDEGIEAFQTVSKQMPVTVWPANLPDDLSQFLDSLLPLNEGAPIVIYNTYMTTYLRDEGWALRMHISNWAQRQQRRVLWAQAEPARHGMESPYGTHWCAWTVDLWEPNNSSYCHWNIAWVHPHGTTVKWLEPDLTSFIDHFCTS